MRPASVAFGLGALLLLLSSPLLAQPAAQLRVPMERYSLLPYLEEDALFVQGSMLPDNWRLDISLGLKYVHQPWRIFVTPDEVQSPVEDMLQIRPGVSFNFRGYAQAAVVVPFSHQVAGTATNFPTIQNPEGLHLLDPEIFLRVPFMRKRVAGFGASAGAQVFIPAGEDKDFVGAGHFRAALHLGADFVLGSFALALNTGVLIQESREVLETQVGSEFFLRPAASYLFPVGGYGFGIMAEANLATALSSFFSERNGNAFQVVFSLVLRPRDAVDGGFYAIAGGGSRLQGGGYAVPISNMDARLGYGVVFQEGSGGEGPADVEARSQPSAKTAPQTVASAGTAAGTSGGTSGQETYESPEDTSRSSAPSGQRPRVQDLEGGEVPPPPVEVADSRSFASRGPTGVLDYIRVNFSTGLPGPTGDRSGSADLPGGVRQQVQDNRDKILAAARAPGARLVVIGFTDKCFEGPPFLAAAYNQDLGKRRAQAMVALLRDVLGADFNSLDVRVRSVGWRCANPRCQCATPDMPECASDRKVELAVQFADEEYRCPEGEYWLAR